MKHTANKPAVKTLSSLPSYDDAPLSPRWAFVVHFRLSTVIGTDIVSGRVEHVVSGRSTHFTSLEELLAFTARVLQEVQAKDPHGRSARRDGS